MYHFSSYSKSVNNLKILFSPSNKLSNSLSLLFYASSFNLFISFLFLLIILILFPFQRNRIHKVFQKKSTFISFFQKNLHFVIKVVKSTSNFSNISFISSSNTFNLLFVSFFISFISCSLSNSSSFISFNIFFKPFNSSLNSSIIIYFSEGVKEKVFLVYLKN